MPREAKVSAEVLVDERWASTTTGNIRKNRQESNSMLP